jgi:Flp pilus assembly protein TadD
VLFFRYPSAIVVVYSFGSVEHLDEQRSTYENALRNTENNHVILGNYIIHLMAHQKYEQAIEMSEELLKIKPDSATAYINLGVSLVETGKFDDAKRNFESALKYSDKSADIYYNLAMLAERRERFDEAELYYRKAIQAEPNNTQLKEAIDAVLKKNGTK